MVAYEVSKARICHDIGAVDDMVETFGVVAHPIGVLDGTVGLYPSR